MAGRPRAASAHLAGATVRPDSVGADASAVGDRGRDEAIFVALAIVHAAALVAIPSIPLIAIGLWWNANTVAHNFIHRPVFRSAGANRVFSAGLSLTLGLPQALWRQRHLHHHAEAMDGRPRPFRITGAIMAETLMVAVLWTAIAMVAPRFFLWVYAPGWTIGLGLCQLQGHFEHARGTTSHYGRIYNALFFNDGYHVEHHLRPAAHWRDLPSLTVPDRRGSRWPPVLRWLEAVGFGFVHVAGGRKPAGTALDTLERGVLRSSRLQRFVLDRHERAFRRLLPSLGPVARICIVGGGLFPRTALILRRLLPHATITIVDSSAKNLETARRFLEDDIAFVQAVHHPGTAVDADLVVIPLAYHGDRRLIYGRPPASKVIVHDWIWSARPKTARVSWLLLKRLNLIQAAPRG